MSLRKKKREIQRLYEAFEKEAIKFHVLSLSKYALTQTDSPTSRKFRKPNHSLMLWQFFGQVFRGDDGSRKLVRALEESDLKWGIRGAELTLFAVLEGEGCELFVRMAKRAGGLFSEKESDLIKTRLKDELYPKLGESVDGMLTVFVTNTHPLAIWLNFLLYHLSVANPGREKHMQIEPDPFTLSMLALERLLEAPEIAKSDRSVADIDHKHFRVAMSFSGDRRALVSEIVSHIRSELEPDAVFYDFDYKAQLARPNLDTLLQDIYRNRSDLVVVFLGKEYASREWCGLEWRAIREIIKVKEDKKVMLVRCDGANIDGLFSIDGYIDANTHSSLQIAKCVLERAVLIDN